MGLTTLALNVILVLFVIGWVGSLAAEIFREGYSAPTGLNETMIALVTALFVAQQRLTPPAKNNGNGDGGGNASGGDPQQNRTNDTEGTPS